MRLWIDDVRPAPEGWTWAKSVDIALKFIGGCQLRDEKLEISLDYDAGDYAVENKDYIDILDTLEVCCNEFEFWKDYVENKVVFHLHSANPVGCENMRRIIKRNGWKEI